MNQQVKKHTLFEVRGAVFTSKSKEYKQPNIFSGHSSNDPTESNKLQVYD